MNVYEPYHKILPDVPRIGFDIHLSPFPGSLFACLEYIKDPCDYDVLMALTGAAFRRLWNRDDGGNVDLSYFGDGPFQRVFAALGYDWISYPPEKEAMLSGIRESLSRGVPAISFGIFGPPEAGLITGFDEASGVLYGWSYFQDQPAHYYEKTDWYETMIKGQRGLIVLGVRSSPRRSISQSLISALEWAIDLETKAHRPSAPDHISGLAACDAWADAFEVDADYPVDDPHTMGIRAMVYGDQALMVEERQYAASFLRKAANEIRTTSAEAGLADQLLRAAGRYDQAADLRKIWLWGDDVAESIPSLSDPVKRRELATAIRTISQHEKAAVAELVKALQASSKTETPAPKFAIDGAIEQVGYEVSIFQKAAFQVAGYTIVIPPGEEHTIPAFWAQVEADGRLETLEKASGSSPWVLGLGSWDPECEKKGQRYTICIEVTEHTDFTDLVRKHSLFTKQIGASDWMCFKLTGAPGDTNFWQDDPYRMLKELGYIFHAKNYNLGLHFDAYPPGHDDVVNPALEFWITVKKKSRP
jgi:predicted transcriptional regulator YdeE